MNNMDSYFSRSVWFLSSVLGTLLFMASAWAELPTPEELKQVLAKMDRIMNPGSAEYFISIVNEVPGKDAEEVVLYALYSEDRWAAVISSPEHQKGRSILRLGSKIWHHVPGELEPRIGQLSQSLFNGVLDNRVLFRMNDLPLYTAKAVESDGNRLAMDLLPNSREGGLPVRYMVFNTQLSIPESETVFSSARNPVKEILYQDVREFGDWPPRPSKIVVRSLVNNGYVTTMTIGWLESKTIPEEAFTLPLLPTVGIFLKKFFSP